MSEFPKFLPWAFLGIALLGLTSPLWVYWYIHGDYERYMRIIEGPLPMGSGPFQLALLVSLLFVGFVSLIVFVLLNKMSKFK